MSLTEALQTAFPVVQKLVGETFFHAMAGHFLRTHPPRSPVLMTYGAEFSDFLSDFPPVAHLPYLSDVARLEQALRESYHAADAPAFDPAIFSGLSPKALNALILTPAPSTRLIASSYPIFGIWAANSGATGPMKGAQGVLVTRPDFDPAPHVLTPAQTRFLSALFAGTPLAQAAETAGDALDLSATLGLLLRTGALT